MITSNQFVHFTDGDEIFFMEEVTLEIQYSGPVQCDENHDLEQPMEIEKCIISPATKGVVWSKFYREAIEKQFPDEKLFEIVKEEMG